MNLTVVSATQIWAPKGPATTTLSDPPVGVPAGREPGPVVHAASATSRTAAAPTRIDRHFVMRHSMRTGCRAQGNRSTGSTHAPLGSPRATHRAMHGRRWSESVDCGGRADSALWTPFPPGSGRGARLWAMAHAATAPTGGGQHSRAPPDRTTLVTADPSRIVTHHRLTDERAPAERAGRSANRLIFTRGHATYAP